MQRTRAHSRASLRISYWAILTASLEIGERPQSSHDSPINRGESTGVLRWLKILFWGSLACGALSDIISTKPFWSASSDFIEFVFSNIAFVLLTVYVLRGAKRARKQAEIKDGESWRIDLASLEVPHGNHDAARIALDAQIAKPLRIAHRSPAYDESLFFFGDAFGAGVMNAEVGMVVGIGPIEFEHTADIVKGMSGGPIVDAEGVVVGICQKGRKTTAHKNGEALPTDDSKYLKVRRFATNLRTVKWQRYAPAEK